MFKAGEKVYVWKLAMDDDELAVFLISSETFAVQKGGSTQQTRYKALLDFKFEKGSLPSADFANVKAAIDSVLASEQEALAPKNISIGQTEAEVEASVGKPEKIINLGPKKVYVYKDLKVIFVDDKVADVQ